METMLTLDDVIRQLHDNQERLGIELKPPASEALIQQLEQALGGPLPPDFAAFYRYCNGFSTLGDLFQLGSIDWILQWSGRLAERRFEVADYMISSDTWDVVLEPASTTGYRIVNADHGSDLEVTLTTSLYAFISRFLNGDGAFDLYQWYEEEKRKLR